MFCFTERKYQTTSFVYVKLDLLLNIQVLSRPFHIYAQKSKDPEIEVQYGREEVIQIKMPWALMK